jgi:hypothetical protein
LIGRDANLDGMANKPKRYPSTSPTSKTARRARRIAKNIQVELT